MAVGLLVCLTSPGTATSDHSPEHKSGFVFYRKPAPGPASDQAAAGPTEDAAGPETAEPRAAAAPARAPGSHPVLLDLDGMDLQALREENARQRAHVAALEDALAQAQAELNTLQAKLQAILTVPQPEDTEKTRVYRVQEGDTLYTIAQRPDIYGDGRLWKRIHEANRHHLADPARLQPGLQLIIPR